MKTNEVDLIKTKTSTALALSTLAVYAQKPPLQDILKTLIKIQRSIVNTVHSRELPVLETALNLIVWTL